MMAASQPAPISLSSPIQQKQNKARSSTRYRPSLPWEGYEFVHTPSEFPSISDFLFKSLDRRFLEHYEMLLTCITYLEIDEFDIKVLLHENQYTEAVQIFTAYRTYAPHCRSNLVSAVLNWRTQQQNKKTEWSDFFKEGSNPKVQGKDSWWILEEKKMMLVNYLWAKITWLIFQEDEEGEPLETQVAVKCLEFCFSSLLGQSSKLKCFEPNYLIYVEIVTELFGVLSKIVSIGTMDRISSEIDKCDMNKSSADLSYLFMGVKGIHLDFSDQRLAPEVMKLITKFLSFTDKQKKVPDQIRAGALECLTSFFTTLATSEPASSNLPQGWAARIEEAYGRMSYLQKKGKTLQLVFPLESAMISACSRDFFAESYPPLLETLLKMTKPGDKLRVCALDSLYRFLLCSFFWPSIEDDVVDKICRRISRELTQSSGRKPSPPQEEAVEVIVDIIGLIIFKKVDFGLNELIVPLLKFNERDLRSPAELGTERLIIAFLSAKQFFTKSAPQNPLEDPRYTNFPKGTLPRKFRENFLMNLKFEEGANTQILSLGCGGAMDQLFPMMDSQFGNLLLTNQAKSLQEVVPAARLPQLDLLSISISCLSYCFPNKMEISTLMGMLARLTLHLHEPTRNNTIAALRDIIRTRPDHRALLINQMALFIPSINDANLEQAASSLLLLNSLMSQWYNLACSEVPEVYQKPESIGLLDVCGLEAVFLIYFCQPGTQFRSIVYDSFQILWKLLKLIPRHLSSHPPQYVISTLAHNASKIVEEGKKGPASFPYDTELFEDIKSSGGELNFQPVEMARAMSAPVKTLTLTLPTPVRGIQSRLGTDPLANTARSLASSSNQFLRQDSSACLFQEKSPFESEDEGWIELEALLVKDTVTNEAWTSVLGKLTKVLASECPYSSFLLHKYLVVRMDTSYEALLDAEREKNFDPSGHFLLWKNYLVAAVATCGSVPSQDEKSNPQGFFKHVFSYTKSDNSMHALACDYSMNYLSSRVIPDVFSTLQPLFQELSKSKKLGSKKDPLRVHVAKVVKSCSEVIRESTSNRREDVLQGFVSYLQDAFWFLNSQCDTSNAIHWTIFSLKYSLFSTIPFLLGTSFRNFSRNFDSLFPTDLRKKIFSFISRFVGVGSPSRTQKQAEQKQLEELLLKLKTNEEKASFKNKITDSIQMIERVAGDAMKSLLNGKGFDPSVFEPSGPVLEWASSLFQSQDLSRQELGRSSLFVFIDSNCQTLGLTSIWVEKSYLSDKQVAQNFFVSLCEYITRPITVDYSIQSILLLVMYKLGDPRQEVRRAAVKLLMFLCDHHFESTGGYQYLVFPDADIDPSFTFNAVSLSKALARDCPELTFFLLEELMIRVPVLDPTGQKRMLWYFSHWMVNIDLRAEPQDRVASCLKSLFILTVKLGHDRVDIENMWVLLAQKETNVAPILNYLFEYAVFAQSRDCVPYCKQIALYVSRASPRATVVHLVTELRSMDVRNLGLEKVHRGGTANPLSWKLMEILPAMIYQEPLSRSNLAIAMLANVVTEQGKECSPFLPRILHTIFLAGDRRNDIITSNAHLLLYNTLLSLLVERPEYQDSINVLTSRMHLLRSAPSFWAFEDLKTDKLELTSTVELEKLVQFVLDILPWRKTLVEEWGNEALEIILSTDNNHLLTRSLQIYRSLKPRMKSCDLQQLLCRLKSYFAKRENLSVGLEIIYTLRAAVEWTPKEELEAMPQFFWAAVAILHSNDPVEYNAGALLLSGISRVEFNGGKSQKYLLSIFPEDGWSPPFQGFLSLVLKGMTNRFTEDVSLRLLADACMLPHGPVIDIDPKRRLLLNTLCLLPHLGLFMGKGGTVEIAKGLGCMFDYGVGAYLDNASSYAEIFQRYSSNGFTGVHGFLEAITAEIALAFFPHYELLTFSILAELLDRGNPQYERIVLMLVDMMTNHVKVDNSMLHARGMSLFSPVEQRIVGSHSDASINVTKKLVMSIPLGQIQIAHAKHMNVIQRLGDMQIQSVTWNDSNTAASLEGVIVGLENILESFKITNGGDFELEEDSISPSIQEISIRTDEISEEKEKEGRQSSRREKRERGSRVREKDRDKDKDKDKEVLSVGTVGRRPGRRIQVTSHMGTISGSGHKGGGRRIPAFNPPAPSYSQSSEDGMEEEI